ncbi:hypothetical protein C0J52_00715 [Blattella germanica]|nr:hypothetical protein C0J52_00715 [Blattella germanica]
MGPKTIEEQNGDSRKLAVTFEEAIALTNSGRFHLLLLLGCGCCLVAMVGETFGLSFIIPAAQCEFDMGPSEKGLLNAISYIGEREMSQSVRFLFATGLHRSASVVLAGMIASSHLWGYLADTKGRRKVLIVALVVDGVCAVVSSFSPFYWLFLLLRFCCGFMICAPSAVVFAYLGEFHSTPTRTRAILLMSVFLSCGGLYQQGMGWAVVPRVWALEVPGLGINFGSWRAYLLACSLPSFLAAILLAVCLPESPKYLFSVGKDKEALDVLRHVFSKNTGRSPEEYPVLCVMLDAQEQEAAQRKKPKSVLQVLRSMWAQTKPLFQAPHALLTGLAFVMQFSFYASFNGLAMWLPDLFNRYIHFMLEHPGGSGLTLCQVVDALKSNATSTNATTEGSCSSEVDPDVFRDSLAIGLVCITTYSVAGYIVNFVDKKRLMGKSSSSLTSAHLASPRLTRLSVAAVCLLISSSAGMGLSTARVEWLIVLLCAVFIAMSGACVNMLNSIVIDSIPTQLRAMAVCLSLMAGRFGVTSCSLAMGVLLESSCDVVFFMLGGLVLPLFCPFVAPSDVFKTASIEASLLSIFTIITRTCCEEGVCEQAGLHPEETLKDDAKVPQGRRGPKSHRGGANAVGRSDPRRRFDL